MFPDCSNLKIRPDARERAPTPLTIPSIGRIHAFHRTVRDPFTSGATTAAS